MIFKGKTERTLKKVRNGANSTVNKVKLYYSEKGWINSGIIVRWLKDVVAPYTQRQPAALALDDYAAHWTAEVRKAAKAIKLQLIAIPNFKGATAKLQPLDVQFNGILKATRTRIWTEMRQQNPELKDSEQRAVERSQLAYESITKEQTCQAFIKAGIHA